jgi:hypothetical protein
MKQGTTMLQQQDTGTLAALLDDFAGQFNGHASLRTMLAAWTPQFFIQGRDQGGTFQIHLAQGQVTRISEAFEEPDDEALLLRADLAVLQQIFTGRLSPLGAYTDGLLEVYGSQKDQIKLDVIALVVWGA